MKTVAFVLLTAIAAPAQAEPDLTAQLDALVAPHFDANAPGAAVLVTKGDQILLRKGYGLADVEMGVPMRPDFVFRLGSVTKQFTAAAILILADAGKISLGDDVRKYVPEYRSRVTLEQLLTHTSGVPDFTDQPAFQKRRREDLSQAEVLETFKDLPLEFSPDEKWSYSNSGYYLLGIVIEKVSGKSYAAFLDETIFKPLGMRHTSYGDDERIITGRVSGYDRPGDTIRNADLLSMKLPFAAGGLVSSVDDLATWDRAIAAGKLLKKTSWARAFTDARLKEGKSTHYGFGWAIGAYQGHRVVSHSGGIPGFSTAILRMPDDHVLAVVLCNSIPAQVDPLELTRKLAATAIGKPIVDSKRITIATDVLDRYVGVYKVDDKVRVLVRRDGDHLTQQRTGGPLLSIDAESETKFFVKGSLLRFAFSLDRAGRVTGFDVTLPDGNVEHRARTDEPLPAERAVVTVDARVLDGYLGNYDLGPGFVLAITREGAQLFAQATGQPRLPIFAASPTEFFLKAVDAQLSFHADAKGRADSLVLHQGGRDLPGKRIL